jgi:hypothetical protein
MQAFEHTQQIQDLWAGGSNPSELASEINHLFELFVTGAKVVAAV